MAERRSFTAHVCVRMASKFSMVKIVCTTKRLSLVQCVHTAGDTTCYIHTDTHREHFRTILYFIFVHVTY